MLRMHGHFAALMIRRIHQKLERHLKRLIDFERIKGEPKIRFNERNNRGHDILRNRPIFRQSSENFDMVRSQPNFFEGLAQRSLLWRLIALIATPTRESNLSGVIGQMGRAARQQKGWTRRAQNNRHQDRRRRWRSLGGVGQTQRGRVAPRIRLPRRWQRYALAQGGRFELGRTQRGQTRLIKINP